MIAGLVRKKSFAEPFNPLPFTRMAASLVAIRIYLKKNVGVHGKARNGEKAEHTCSM